MRMESAQKEKIAAQRRETDDKLLTHYKHRASSILRSDRERKKCLMLDGVALLFCTAAQ
jgi:hypothetical protein